jgi:hypothetical protein
MPMCSRCHAQSGKVWCNKNVLAVCYACSLEHEREPENYGECFWSATVPQRPAEPPPQLGFEFTTEGTEITEKNRGVKYLTTSEVMNESLRSKLMAKHVSALSD